MRVLACTGLGAAALFMLTACAVLDRTNARAGAAAPSARSPLTAESTAAKNQTAPAAPAAAPDATPAAASAASAPLAAAAPATALAPGMPPPFAALLKGARRIDGPVTVWQNGDKVWLELLPSQFGKPYLLSPKIKDGIGEAWVLGGLMAYPVEGVGGPQVIEFLRVHNTVRMQARNTELVAKAGTPEARAVEAAYSHSLLGAVPVASQPHPERKSVLVDASALFLNDLMGISQMLQRGLRQSYGLDRNNSLITGIRGSDQATIIETQAHFFLAAGVPASQASALSRLLGSPGPRPPRYLPDARSMLVGLHYSIGALPETPMATRRADPRVGLFSTTVLDFSDDLAMSPRQRFIHRWRLDKKDPAAAVSEPVKPITFWIDRNVPLAYRETVRAAILEWNKAFEKIGFSQAIQVQQQADDARFDTLDFGIASVRWMMNAEPAFGAIGPSHVDPRTGEILDADIAFEGLSARSVRTLRAQVMPAAQADSGIGPASALLSPSSTRSLDRPFTSPWVLPGMRAEDAASAFGQAHAHCQHASLAAEQLGYALDLLEARGDMPADSPLAQQFVQDYVKDSIMHEVGHALGLRHNFRASRAYTEAQLGDAEFTRANGTSASVMEYNAINLPAPGERAGVPFQTALGPYDYWAIEYAYRPLAPGTSAAAEKAFLLAIAARSNEPLLAFGTDEDNAFGIDPETLQLDLGADPIAFARKRLAIARDLLRRQEARELPPDADYSVLRRSVGYAVNDVTRAMGILVRQIGGLRTLRDYPGSGRDPLQPLPAAQQRQALALISEAVLSTHGLKLSPALQRRLAPDYLDRAEFDGGGTNFQLHDRLLSLQRAVLAYLMSEGIAARVLDSASKVDAGVDVLGLNELYQHLARQVWQELELGQPAARGAKQAAAGALLISADRRDLQREFVNRLAFSVVRPGGSGRADSRGLLRAQAQALLLQLDASRRSAGDPLTQSHLADSAETLRQALAARIERQAL